MANITYPCTLKAVSSGVVVRFDSKNIGTVIHSGTSGYAVGTTKDGFWVNMHRPEVWGPYSKKLRLLQALKEIR